MAQQKSILITNLQAALKLTQEVDDAQKQQGLAQLNSVLELQDEHITALGYDLVIFKELNKMITFENGSSLHDALDILETHFFRDKRHWDELAETLIMRAVRSNELDTCKACMEKILSLVNIFDDSIAKHSKQLLKLADINYMIELNPIISEILLVLKQKLPKRKCDT